MKFDLICEKLEPNEDGTVEQAHYCLDTLSGKLWVDDTHYIGLSNDNQISKIVGNLIEEDSYTHFEDAWKEKLPGKSGTITKLKIQMGMSCNYSCQYCSQKFVERPEQGTPEKVDSIIEKIQKNLTMPKYGKNLKIEFWGGEPFVYWKTMKPLAEKLRILYPSADFSVITNGSLLTKDIVDWLEGYNFSMSISHDGPAQEIRGPDPLSEEGNVIAYAVERFHKRGRGAFGSMLHRKSTSRLAIQKWFDERFGPGITIGEGGLIDAYDDDGYELSLQTKVEHFDFRKQALSEILGEYKINFSTVDQKVRSFVTMLVENHKLSQKKGQKCGMDSSNTIAVDMNGDVITCQNVSAVSMAMNGTSHKIGNIEELDKVELHSATHWTARPHCQKCPVIHTCSGNCMFIQGDKWFRSCDNAYSDNVVMLAVSILHLTGYLPVYIDAPHLPDHRKDIWGDILKHEEEKPKATFKIPVVAA